MAVPEFSDYIYETIYPGWGRVEAEGDWREQGDKKWADYIGSSGGFDIGLPGYEMPEWDWPTAEDYIESIVGIIPELPEEYMEKHPFWFDEEAAKELAVATFSPYYEEMLGDYLSDIETQKTRLGHDEVRILGELEAQKDYFRETSGDRHQRLLRDIGEGYSGRGLYFGGERKRTTGEAQTDYQRQLEDYMRGYRHETGGVVESGRRHREDWRQAAERRSRDIGREKHTAVTGHIQQQRGEALEEWLHGMGQYYETPDWRDLLTGTESAVAGY